MHCTLLAPHLLAHTAADSPRPPRLEALLARGEHAEFPAGDATAWLCEQFGIRRQNDWPVAALTLALDGGDSSRGYWLRCDPVHFHLQRNRMYLSDAAGIPSAEESQALIAALNHHFAGEGIFFHAGAEDRWYVRADTHTGITTTPLADAMNRDVDTCLPAGDDRNYWRRTLNEIQMLLHTHPVNAAREARGLPAFNSVWLWGGGIAQEGTISPFAGVWSDDALARALAGRSAVAAAAVPPNAEAVFAAGKDALVVLATGGDPALDAEAWRRNLAELERCWFAPCHAALRSGKIKALSIIATGPSRGRRIDVTRAGLRRWWRRARALATYA